MKKLFIVTFATFIGLTFGLMNSAYACDCGCNKPNCQCEQQKCDCDCCQKGDCNCGSDCKCHKVPTCHCCDKCTCGCKAKQGFFKRHKKCECNKPAQQTIEQAEKIQKSEETKEVAPVEEIK